MKSTHKTLVYFGFHPDFRSVTTLVTTLSSLKATGCPMTAVDGKPGAVHSGARGVAHPCLCTIVSPPLNPPSFCIDSGIGRHPCAGPDLRLQYFHWWWSISWTFRNKVSATTLKRARLLWPYWYKVYHYSQGS
jgi:hypothetical protein